MSLTIRNLTFTYEKAKVRGVPLIDDFSAEFRQDKVTALTGKNGAGKTTLSRIIMGILKPVSGEIFLGDRLLNDLTLAQRGENDRICHAESRKTDILRHSRGRDALRS